MGLTNNFIYFGLLCSFQRAFGAEIFISYPSSNIAEKALLWSKTKAEGTSLTGRVRLYFTKDNSTDPIYSASDEQSTGQVFGIDAVSWDPNDPLVIDDSVFGYPQESLIDIPDDTYYMQAELFLYDMYSRTGLPDVYMPTSCVSDQGLNGEYAKPDGTLFSQVFEVDFTSTASIQLSLDQVHPPAVSEGCAGLGDGVDSDWVKTVRITSQLLTSFWNRDIELEACVLVPPNWNSSAATYPLVVSHGHYSPVFFPGGGFQTEQPDCDPDEDGYDCVQSQYAYYLAQNWTSLDDSSAFSGARMILMTINHPVPLFDDSYAVNSASLGPYGDAIVTELIPEVEARFNGIGAGWARALYGGSTGGWETLASQVLYPDDFNGAFAACPDPITFSSYATIDIYSTSNAYFYDSDFKKTPRPGQRDDYSGVTWPGYGHPYGQTTTTIQEANHRELVLGTHSRSCGQWDIWEAVFGPVCDDGFPCRLYDKLSGEMNQTTAGYWQEHFDLKFILDRDWETLGPKLQGKLHLFVGNSDTYFLTNAVMDMEDFLGQTSDPSSDAEVVIGTHNGRGYEHCFRGYEYEGSSGTPLPNSITRLTYNQAFMPRMAEQFLSTAPSGADTSSWRY
mmetsp:Transcript_25169/g.32742  ORF Transcript_25169/g.32742 Transcript_25169/m.32742 type:complete len:618 (-) Transcript_25169:72-1925(-)